MLKKLIKYDFSRTYKLMLSTFAITLGLGLINGLILLIPTEDSIFGILSILTGLLGFAYFISIIACVALSFAISIYRFYKNFYTEEGYMMLTLPVTTSQLVLSKFIVSAVWCIASLIVAVQSIFILIFPSNSQDLSNIINFFNDTLLSVGFTSFEITALFIETALLLVFSSIYSVSRLCGCISLGQVIMPKHRIGGAFVAYIALQIIAEIIVSVLLLIAGILADVFVTVQSITPAPFNIMLFIWGLNVLIILLTVMWFFVNRYILKHKLNIE